MPNPKGVIMQAQALLNTVAETLTKPFNPETHIETILQEVYEIFYHCERKTWKRGLKNVAKAYSLKVPGCLK